jgi:phosphoserine phosphatase RsbU/P
MLDDQSSKEAGLEVVAPGGARRFVRITESPFFIGRGGETAKHLQLADPRISRSCAAILVEAQRHVLEDRGQRHGIFVNGQKVERRVLDDGDVVTFGVENFYELKYRASTMDSSITDVLNRIEHLTATDPASGGGLHKLNVLLEATALLHSRLPLDSVLGTMLDHAITVTDADRGLLLEADPAGALQVRLGRQSGGRQLAAENVTPSQTAVRMALDRHSSVITEDLAQAVPDLQGAVSIVAQRLRAVVVIPLYAMPQHNSMESTSHGRRGDFLGVVYLDSRRPAAFSKLDRRILDALASEAASILDNARLVERERERKRLEQELGIARDIQQALLPRGFRDFPHMTVSGTNIPCLTVGGDYFDVFPMDNGRTAFLIADVSGKGLGAALLTTMLQGALTGMSIGADPARVFEHINRFLCEHAEVGRYATMFFGVLDPDGTLEFINAGHPSPLLLCEDGICEPFSEGSFPVGLVDGAEYAVAQHQLRPGDTMILFSDGVTEAMDPAEEMFGVERCREALGGLRGAPLEQLQRAVLDGVQKFTRGAAQADDITVLLVRYGASPASPAS